MGACTFMNTVARGRYPSVQDAFENLCEQDRYENGHMYSGGIGMKDSLVYIATVETVTDALDLAQRLIQEDDPRIEDKWGPAGYITINSGDTELLFFGWASS